MGKINADNFKKELLKLKRVGLDSMCFIYQFANHPLYSLYTTIIISLMEKNKISTVTSTITVVEVFVHEERIGDTLILHAYDQALKTTPNLEIVPVDWNIARAASKLRAKYSFLKTPDALQLATSLIKGCNGFVTNDARLKKIKETKVVVFDDYL